MATLSMQQVASLAYDAGITNPVRLAQAVAVASAESGRNPASVGDESLQTEKWGPSIGLWQVRSLKAEKGKGTIRDADKLTDPRHNAKAMSSISSNGSDWSAWTVTRVTNPAGFLRYQAALPLAPAAVTAMLAQRGVRAGTEAVQDAAGAVMDPIAQLAGVVSDAVQRPVRILGWLTEGGTWVRIGLFLGGGVALVLGVVLIVRGPMMSLATEVAPVGKMMKLGGGKGGNRRG